MAHFGGMRAVLHLLTAICLIWCALGVGEPVEGHGPAAVEHVAMSSDAAPDAPDDGGPIDAAHHHHCPVAPDLAGCQALAEPVAIAAPMIVAGVPALASRTHQPPLQPPSA